MDDKLTGRRFTARGEEFAVPDSEYADDTAVLFPTRQDLEDGVPKVMSYFAKWGMEVHSGNRATHPVKESKTEILFVAKPASLYADSPTFDGADLSDINLTLVRDASFLLLTVSATLVHGLPEMVKMTSMWRSGLRRQGLLLELCAKVFSPV